MADRNAIYESDISDRRWIAYDLPGNAGWILYCVGLGMPLAGATAHAEPRFPLSLLAAAAVPALLMLVGIAELIDERVRRLDRALPRFRLLRGFGALTLGGAAGAAMAVVLLLWAVMRGAGTQGWMWFLLTGGLLCGVFAGLLFRRYKRKPAPVA